MSQNVGRETLYEEVWADPVTVVAKRYGLPDVGLANALQDDGHPSAGARVLGQVAGRG